MVKTIMICKLAFYGDVFNSKNDVSGNGASRSALCNLVQPPGDNTDGRMLCTVLVLAVVVCAALAAKGGKMEKLKVGGKSRSLVYRSTSGTLFEQFIVMKTMHARAVREQRELVLVYGSDDKSSAGGYNLCDIFVLPDEIRCEKHMKMKCAKDGAGKDEEHKKPEGESKDKPEHKRKVTFECEPPNVFDSVEAAEQAVQVFPAGFALRLQNKRTEEIQYVQAMLGVVRKHSSKLNDYTAVYWGDAHQHLGKDLGTCSAGAEATAERVTCTNFKAAAAAVVQASQPYCSHLEVAGKLSDAHSSGACYIAGAADATAQEAAILLDMGLQSFRGMWLQHQAQQDGVPSGTLSKLDATKLQNMLLHIAPASVEVMEWGLMHDAGTFVTLTAGASAALQAGSERRPAGSVLVLTSLAEYERARAGKTFCTAHKAGLATAAEGTATAADPTFCGSVKAAGYVYTDLGNTGKRHVRNVCVVPLL
jgi:hypothetical protein